MGCYRICVGGAGDFPFRSRSVSQTRRKGPMTITCQGKHAYGCLGSRCRPIPHFTNPSHPVTEYAAQQMMTAGAGTQGRPNHLGAALRRHRRAGPLRGAGEANPGCTELMRGKAACHSVGAILRRSALTRRGRRHGMGHADRVLRSANLNESIPFGPNNPVIVMRSSFDPMSSAHRRGE